MLPEKKCGSTRIKLRCALNIGNDAEPRLLTPAPLSLFAVDAEPFDVLLLLLLFVRTVVAAAAAAVAAATAAAAAATVGGFAIGDIPWFNRRNVLLSMHCLSLPPERVMVFFDVVEMFGDIDGDGVELADNNFDVFV